MMRLFAAIPVMLLALILLIPQSAFADYADGTVEDNYTYHDGYWYYHDNAYSRSYVQPTANYYYNGYLYPGKAGYYNYTFHHARSDYPITKVAPINGYENPNWKTELIQLAKQRDKVELEIRKKSADQIEYLQAIKALNLNFGPIQGYGQAIPYPGNGYNSNSNLGSFGANGQTQYGYSYEQVRQQYGDTNLMSLYQASIRLAQAARDSGNQATTETNGLIQSAGDAAGRIAEIGARAAAAERVFKSTEPQASSQTTTRITRTGTANSYSSVQSDDSPDSPGQRLARRAVLNARCAACHGNQKSSGGFRIAEYDSSDPEQKRRLIAYITTNADDEHHCPKDRQGHGINLPDEERNLLIH